MKLAASLLFVPLLSGCWFVMFPIPTSLFQEGNACASDGVQVKQILRYDDGRWATVEKVLGRHQRCQDAKRPILVDVTFEEKRF